MKTQLFRIGITALTAYLSVSIANAEPVVMGKDYVNSAGVTMDFRKKSDQGNPFWRSVGAPLQGLDPQSQSAACLKLTKQEQQAGNLPNGYAYYPNANFDGNYVLMPTAELGLGDIPLAIPTAKAGFYKSPYAPHRADVNLTNSNLYPSGRLIKCPHTGRIFKMP